MKLALLVLVAVAWAQRNSPQSCFPPSCRIDANCVDSIHSTQGKCCGGVCTNNQGSYGKMIGEGCTPDGINGYESCLGTCGSGLMCDPLDSRCHALHGVNCNCSKSTDCLSGTCRSAKFASQQRLCGGVNIPNGEACIDSSECKSRLCTSGRCTGLALYATCNIGSALCETPNICRYNFTYPYICLPRCAIDAVGCCYQSSDCVSGGTCSSGSTCKPPPVLPGLDEACPNYQCNNSTLLTCSTQCNNTQNGYCPSPYVCQLRRQLAAGAICGDSAQCPVNHTCTYNGTYSVCTVIPPPPPPIVLGGDCGTSPYNYVNCAPPGNMCQRNGSGTGYGYTCKQNGTTPVGAVCYYDTTGRQYDECVNGSYCGNDAVGTSPTNYVCVAYPAPLPPGSPCVVYAPSPATPQCEGGSMNCGVSNVAPCYGSCSTSGCCTCFAPRTVPDGGKCTQSRQCIGAVSTCVSNGTCANPIGQDCDSVNDCGSAPTFDCSCERKCYLLNTPTPAPTPGRPLAPTAPTPGRCDNQEKAWLAVKPTGEYYSFSYIYYGNFNDPSNDPSSQLVPQTLKLSVADQTKLLAWVCCQNCQYNSRFNAQIYQGYQVDCTAKTLTKLDDTCNDLRNSLAFLNCWTAISPASTHNIGVGALLLAAFTALLQSY